MNIRQLGELSSLPPTAPNPTDYWYRYEDEPNRSSSLGVDGEMIIHHGIGARVTRRELPVVKYTPKGAILQLNCGDNRFVQDGTRRQYAHRTDEEAVNSFVHRKRAQRNILRSQLDQVESAFITGQQMLSKLP